MGQDWIMRQITLRGMKPEVERKVHKMAKTAGIPLTVFWSMMLLSLYKSEKLLQTVIQE
jgi:hypothetical protein